jgi:hypothetical protein
MCLLCIPGYPLKVPGGLKHLHLWTDLRTTNIESKDFYHEEVYVEVCSTPSGFPSASPSS